MLHRLLREEAGRRPPSRHRQNATETAFSTDVEPLALRHMRTMQPAPRSTAPKRQMRLSKETLADPPALATRPKKTGRLATTAPTTKGMSRLGKQKYVPLEPPSLPTIQIFAALRAIAMILAGRQSDRRHAGIASMQLGMTGPTVFGVPLCRPAGWVSAWRKMAAQSMKDAPVRR
jgi:hypothetical protein